MHAHLSPSLSPLISLSAASSMSTAAAGGAAEPPGPPGLALLQAVGRRDLAAVQAALDQPLQQDGINALHVRRWWASPTPCNRWRMQVDEAATAALSALLPIASCSKPQFQLDRLLHSAGVDINARLQHTWGAATAYALPAGLILDVELPASWPFDGHTPLRTALVMGNLRTSEALLARGQRQKQAWDALVGIAKAQPGEEGLQRMRAAAALLLAHGLPAEEGAVWEAHRVAAELAWPQRQADPEDPWVLSRLLQAHLQAGSGGGEGALGAVVHVLETAINNLDLPAFRAWLPAPALGTLGGPGLLEFLHALGERMVYWAPGLPSAYAEQAMLATLDRFSAALQQAVAQQRRSPSRGIWGGSGRSDGLVANAGGGGAG